MADKTRQTYRRTCGSDKRLKRRRPAAKKGLAKYGRTEVIFGICNFVTDRFRARNLLSSFLLLSSTKVFQSAFVAGFTSIYSRTSPGIERYTASMEPIIKSIKINIPDGGSESVYAEQIEIDTYKLIENPVVNCRINYGTVVRVEDDGNGELSLSKIIRASNFKTRQFMLSASLTESEIRTKIGQPILDAGGMWEIILGGIAFFHIPKDSNFNIDELFKQLNYFPSEIVEDSNGGA